MITLLVITDGRRDCITRTVPSALANLHGPISRKVIYDDSGDDLNRAWLAEQFPGFEILFHPAGRQGFGGAIRTAWRDMTGVHVFHLEDDFTFNRPVYLPAMVEVLDRHPHLVQLALRRQPWNDQERAAGGIVEQHPHDYLDITDGEHWWLEHRRFFTTNPSLYRRTLCDRSWPEGPESEGHFSAALFRDPKAKCGFWGRRDDTPWVEHIGHQRAGVGY